MDDFFEEKFRPDGEILPNLVTLCAFRRFQEFLPTLEIGVLHPNRFTTTRAFVSTLGEHFYALSVLGVDVVVLVHILLKNYVLTVWDLHTKTVSNKQNT
jgi:hypothetical protein